MRRSGTPILVILVVLAIAAAAFFFWPARSENVAEARAQMPANRDSIKKGEYLAKAADCAACHTLANQKPYAGGLPFHLPFGTIYATNITPDRDTGIGQWSDADFVRALHHGVGRNGQDLYPAFPYTSYALLSTEDALAIKDYLFSLEPVNSAAPANQLRFPYNQRYLMRAWKLLFMPSRQFKPDPQRTTEQNHGAYLVEALGHCGECHTPRNALYGLDNGRKFAGAVTAGWHAYNITPEPASGIGSWSDQDLVDYLSQGFAQNHGPASGSMAQAIEFSLHHLSQKDLKAMAAYLRTVQPLASDKGAVSQNPPRVRASIHLSPPQEETQVKSLGLDIFQGACASCHAFDGSGVNDPRAALLGASSVNDPAGINLMQVLLHGSQLKTEQSEAMMPAFGAYRDQELAAVANYVLEHFGAKQAQITPEKIARARTSGD